MQPNPVTIPADATVEDAAKVMDRQSCSCLLVEDRGKVVGIVTERDIVRRVAAKGRPLRSARVESIMTAPIIVVTPEVTVEDALSTMATNKIRRLPVVDQKGLNGLVTLNEIARALAEKLGYENSLLNAMVREPRPPEGVYE
ncbi:MAG: CBS domain-containing protein [Thaumarchaeota archaeon]|nr:CBS domain-containing protein [Nitrososphaerota archaeon]MCS4539889.1 CBS domain-containing protein [Nitrososphaerota archaeon]